MKIQDQSHPSTNWSFCRTHSSNSTTQMETGPNTSWQYSFIPQTSTISIKAAWHSKVEVQFIFAANETFYKRIFFLGKIFELGKTNGKWIFEEKKKSNPTTPSCLDWWLICLEFSGQAFRFLITAISPPISNSLSLRLTQDMEIPICDGRVPFMYFNKRINSYQLSGCPSEFSFSSKVRLFYIKKDAW